MRAHRYAAAAALVFSAAAVVAAVGDASTAVTSQRIAIVERASVDNGGQFELIPLTKGPLKHDAGTVTLSASVGGTSVRAGLTSIQVTATTSAKSKLGTFTLAQKVDSVDVGGGYASERGTWVFTAGTGAYKGVTGKGITASVAFPGGPGQINMRHEGLVHR